MGRIVAKALKQFSRHLLSARRSLGQAEFSGRQARCRCRRISPCSSAARATFLASARLDPLPESMWGRPLASKSATAGVAGACGSGPSMRLSIGDTTASGPNLRATCDDVGACLESRKDGTILADSGESSPTDPMLSVR